MWAEQTIREADVVLWLVDANVPPKPEDRHIAELLAGMHQRSPLKQLIIGLNKIDQLGKFNEQIDSALDASAPDALLVDRKQEYLSLLAWFSTAANDGTSERGEPDESAPEPNGADADGISENGPDEQADEQEALESSDAPEPKEVPSCLFSALSGYGVAELTNQLRDMLPRGPRYYPEDQVTDVQVRFIVEELIREKALGLLSKEVPHSIAVSIDEFSERNKNMTYISAVIYVERDSQKKIVLGSKGEMIKKIGQAARPEIEELVETKVYLELWVKVWEKWRKKSGLLRQLGYSEK